jgi:hypothetical protein
MRFRKFVTAAGRVVDVIEDVKWAETGEPGVIVDGLFICAPDATRAEAGARIAARAKHLTVTSRRPSTASEALAIARESLRSALKESPDDARVYAGQ